MFKAMGEGRFDVETRNEAPELHQENGHVYQGLSRDSEYAGIHLAVAQFAGFYGLARSELSALTPFALLACPFA